MIELDNVRKSYGSQEVLRGITFRINAGEFISIMGMSGSGKTTLLNIIGGLDRDYQGSALVDGREIRGLEDKTLSMFRNRTIGYIFQGFHLLPHLTCAQNVSLPAYFNQALNEEEIAAKVKNNLELVGLLHKHDELPPHLSGGERQRIAIARALFNSPKIILCDEPTGALDSQTGSQIIGLFEDLNRDMGVTMILVTHSESVSAHASRTVHIEDGYVVD
jgi:ABC-type lipoprotein export system ATPase subunit